jgi:glycosyltransferase involved in cell wall biosynthesis
MAQPVLHACDSTVGGVGIFIAHLVEHQRAEGRNVTVVARDDGPIPQRVREMGARFVHWPARADPGPWVAAEMRALACAIRNADPAVVHLHSAKAGLAGRLAVRGRRATVFQPHSWGFFAVEGLRRHATSLWERVGAQWADVILCVSEEERRRGSEAGIRGRYAVLPNGINLSRFTEPNGAPARLALGLDGPVVVCAARLHRQKNQAMLLRAWPAIRARVPDAQLAIVGDGPDREMLESQASPGVRFVGAVDDVRPWLAVASIVVQPSRWEGMSLSVLEAQASARAVIATDVPGMREVMPPDVGALVALDDDSALARAVIERLLDPEATQREGRRARARAIAHHDIRVQHAGISRLYAAVLERRRALNVQPGPAR